MLKHQPSNSRSHRRVGNGDFEDHFRETTAIYVTEQDGYADLFLGDCEVDAMAET